MFTMERYQEEFINSQDAMFMRPYKVSRTAGGGPRTEDDYLSPLIDPDALHDVVYMARVEDKTKKPSLPPPAYNPDESRQAPSYDPVESRQYVIDDAANLEDLIAQMVDYRKPEP